MLNNISELIGEIRKSLHTITAADVPEKVSKEGGIIVDVREPEEVISKPSNANINIPRGVLESQMPKHCPDETLPIFIHCASGARATFAAEQLERIGYQNVWVITCKVDDVIAAI